MSPSLHLIGKILLIAVLLTNDVSISYSQKGPSNRKTLSFHDSSISVLLGSKVNRKGGETSTVWNSLSACCKYTIIAYDLSSDLRSPVRPGEYSLETMHELMKRGTDKVIGKTGGEVLAESEGQWEGYPSRFAILNGVDKVGVLIYKSVIIGFDGWFIMWSPNGTPPNMEIFKKEYFPYWDKYVDSVRIRDYK